MSERTTRTIRRSVAGVIGGALVVVGVALLVLPGPGILVVLAGVSVLAREFVWADRLQARVRDWVAARRRGGASNSRSRPDAESSTSRPGRQHVEYPGTADEQAA